MDLPLTNIDIAMDLPYPRIRFRACLAKSCLQKYSGAHVCDKGTVKVQKNFKAFCCSKESFALC